MSWRGSTNWRRKWSRFSLPPRSLTSRRGWISWRGGESSVPRLLLPSLFCQPARDNRSLRRERSLPRRYREPDLAAPPRCSKITPSRMCGTVLRSSTVAMVRNRSRRVISSRMRDAYCELKDEAKIGSSSQASALFLEFRGPINDQVPFLVSLCRSVRNVVVGENADQLMTRRQRLPAPTMKAKRSV